MFDRVLSSILIKVCMLLRNRFQQIRDVARGTLVKIIETLGCRYLQYLLKEMQGLLVKGYQVISCCLQTHQRLVSFVVIVEMNCMTCFPPPSTQVHVLTFTVHQLLSALSPTLTSGDLDPCMNMLIGVGTCVMNF